MDNYGYCAKVLSSWRGPGRYRVLDYGCGVGKIVEGLRGAGVDAWGCDIFYQGTEASLKSLPLALRRRLKVMKGGRIPFPDASFDAVVSNQVLEHVEDLDKVLGEVHRVLRPGGRFLALFPTKEVWREGHTGIPFLHRFPQGSRLKVLYATTLRALGLGYHKGDKGAFPWAKDVCLWLDLWTHYRPLPEVRAAFGQRFGRARSLENHWLKERLGRLSILATWIPSPLRRWLVTRLCGHIFMVYKEASSSAQRPGEGPGPSGLKGWVPWWAKLGAKLLLARVPLAYSLWSRLGIFKHGKMDDPSYVVDRFENAMGKARRLRRGFRVLELGPGDSVGTALLAKAHGASACYLVDVEDHVRRDLAFYRDLALRLSAKGHQVPSLEGTRDFEGLLSACGATYLTAGLQSLRSIPTGSVDLTLSTSVLEHVSLQEFEGTLRELRRVLRRGGVGVHWVDLKDHLGYSLNNLRFKQSVWESGLFRGSGFYTNRLRRRQMLALFQKAGFRARATREVLWDSLPLPRERMAEPFRSLPEEELRVKGFEVVLT